MPARLPHWPRAHPHTARPSSLQFVEKDPRLADAVIRALLKFWPLTNSHKEVLFLGELEEVLELTQVCVGWVVGCGGECICVGRGVRGHVSRAGFHNSTPLLLAMTLPTGWEA